MQSEATKYSFQVLEDAKWKRVHALSQACREEDVSAWMVPNEAHRWDFFVEPENRAKAMRLLRKIAKGAR